jgi:hypothetical protein
MTPPVSPRRFWILACLVAMAMGLAACGRQAHPTVADADNDGFYVDAGGITYQLQVSRQLNQYSVEDSQYLKGLPPGTPSPTPDQLWYGVFLWAKNQSDQAKAVTDTFTIVDTEGNTYTPVAINQELNPYAWRSLTLLPSASEPAAATTASEGPTQGGLLLFKLNNAVYSNRPLTLLIHAAGMAKPAEISLDL